MILVILDMGRVGVVWGVGSGGAVSERAERPAKTLPKGNEFPSQWLYAPGDVLSACPPWRRRALIDLLQIRLL